MIQKTNSRHQNTSLGLLNQSHQTNGEGREIWGKWVRGKHYSLEVIQHPIRARMCGFGDKDRRPLAPAAVAKLVVRREDDSIVDVDEIDYTFFLATVDLWSEDGKQEMNLVLHPTSADRYVPTQGQKTRRRVNVRPGRPIDDSTPSTVAVNNAYSLRSHNEESDSNLGPPLADASSSGAGYSSNYSAASQQSPVVSSGYTQVQQQSSSEWGSAAQPLADSRSHAPPVLPSIQSLGHGQTSESWPLGESPSRADSEVPAYRGWPPDPVQYGVEGNSQNIDPSLKSMHSNASHSDPRTNGASWNSNPVGLASTSEGFSHHSQSQTRYVQQPQQEQSMAMANTVQADGPTYASATYAQNHPYYQAQDTFQSSSSIPLPRHTYTRTLVGPLSANASRLSDEHRKPGIFFLFQDLSIRTEGVFCLRIRLMNVGALPAPEPGAVRVHNDVSPVLAQTFTNAFTVYSAKRFPGVPDTTALSIAFGNQGQKLPLRNRHGSAKTRKRLRSISDGASEDESD